MKKLFLLVAVVSIALTGCGKIEDAIDKLENRLDNLEQEKIPTIDEQISAINTTLGTLDAMDKELKGYIDGLQVTADNLQKQINDTNTKIDEVKVALQGEISTAKAEVLAQLEATKKELEKELKTINETIETLQTKYEELDGKIKDLRTYVDTELGETTDWVEATFATLEQYNSLVTEIAIIKEQIKATNQSIAALETYLTTKINADIAAAVASLNADIQQKVKEITDGYTDAVKTAKEDITAAYTAAIQTAISNLDSSLKTWVGEQLSNYYTIAQVDALISSLSAEFEGKLSTQKIYLESLITSLSQTLTSKITDNSNLITALRNDLTTLDGEVAKNAEAIANNAEKISENASAIIENSKAIVANGENIEANKGSIEANTKLIAENKLLIEEVETMIDNTSNSANATAIANNAKLIADHAKAIADNAELIAQNSVAINNNAVAIAQNTADIAQLRQDLTTTKTEITEAYKSAISTAITTLNGELRGEIATQISALNTRIDSEVATINNAINALAARVTTLENEVAAIKQQIANILSDIADMKEDIANLLARIQSVSYVPKFSDGNATMDYGTKTAEFDFLVSPKSAVAELAKVWNSALSVKAVYTQTRAVEFINLPITEFVADNNNGVISIKVSGSNLNDAFYTDQQDAKAMLQISDGNSSLTSEYVSMTPNFNIQFEDLQVKAICCKNWDTNNDGELSYAEAAAVETIGTKFKGNTNIVAFTELKYFTSMVEIPNSAFMDCSSLWKIVIPCEVSNIASSSFMNCTSLTTIIFDTTKIERISGGFDEDVCYGAFANCSELRSIVIPKSVTIIESAAFKGCSKLDSVKFENESLLTEIQGGFYQSYHYGAFANCGALESITFPANLKVIGAAAFKNCQNLQNVIFDGESQLTEIGGGWVNGRAACYYYPHGAFQSCTSLSHIEIPENCKTIQYAAFYGCSNLQSVKFAEHSKLESIKGAYYQHNVKGYLGAFAHCSKLTSIVLPSNLNELGTHAFYNCSQLSSIYCMAKTPPTIFSAGYDTTSSGGAANLYTPFSNIASNAKIYIPVDSYDAYVAANYWSSYKSKIVGYNFE